MKSPRFAALAALASLAVACGPPAQPPTDTLAADATGDATADAPAADAAPTQDAGPEAGPTMLAPGAVVELAVAAGHASALLATPSGTERFLVVLASTDLAGPGAGYTYTASAGPPGAPPPAPAPVTGCSLAPDAWRSRPLTMETPPSGAAPAVGTHRMLSMTVGAAVMPVDAQLLAVSEHALVWADVTPGHAATLDATFVQQFLADFDALILPRERTLFGVESDTDHDGRISLVFSPLTYRTAVAYFTGCDLQSLAGCRASNHGEYLYLTPPASIMPPYNTPAAIKEVLAHELGHLLHFNRKVLRNHLTAWHDNANLIEGVGGFTQDASGFQAGNLYVALAGLQGINDFSMGYVLPDDGAYVRALDGVLRGGSYLWVRWLYDRAGGDTALADGALTSRGGPALLRSLLDDPRPIASALPSQTGASMEDLVTDFYTALGVSNRDEDQGAAPVNPCFAYLPIANDPVTMRQRGADLFVSFHGMQMTGPATQALSAADGSLLPGGVEYLVLDASAGQSAVSVALDVDAAALPRVRVARLR